MRMHPASRVALLDSFPPHLGRSMGLGLHSALLGTIVVRWLQAGGYGLNDCSAWRKLRPHPFVRVPDHSRRSIHCVLLAGRFNSAISASRAAARFIFSRGSWVQLWLLRARPIAPIASAVRGMRVAYDKEGTDPCCGYAHYCECVHQRRRVWPAPGLRGVVGRTGAPRTDRPGRPRGRLHNRTGEYNADAHLKRHGPPSEAVIEVTNGRLDGFA